MEKQYATILEGVLKYEKAQQGIIISIFAVALLVMVVLVIKQYQKTSASNKIVMWLVLVAFVVSFCGYILYSESYVKKIQSDLKNGEVLSYNGEYSHDDYQKDSFYHNVYILEDGNTKTTLRYPDYGNHYEIHEHGAQLPLGTCRGTLLYSKSSKIVLDFIFIDA